MILKPQKISFKGTNWWFQEFPPDNAEEEYAVNLYDSNGDFAQEFDSFKKMKQYIESKVSCAKQ